jgi:GNAT superfamily N-acetyltransferase
MTAADTTPSGLKFRAARPDDWPAVEIITAGTWESGDYIDQALWEQWLADRRGQLVAGTLDDEVVVVSKLTRLAEGEWWMEGLRVHPDHRRKGFARAMNNYQVTCARQQGGVLRFATGSDNESVHKIAAETGFQRIARHALMSAPALPVDWRGLHTLTGEHFGVVQAYLAVSPMFQASPRLVEHHWTWRSLSDEYLAWLLETDAVSGWDLGEGLMGLAIHAPEPEQRDEEMRLGLVDGAHIEALTIVARAMRGLAAERGYQRVRWMLPLGDEYVMPVKVAGYEREWDDELWVFELQL